MVSRILPRKKTDSRTKVEKIKELDEFLDGRDYTGAIALLEHKQKSEPSLQNSLWLAYCAYHAGEYQTAVQTYENLLKQKDCPQEVNLYLCCAYLMIGQNDEARKIAEKQPKGELQNRILLHLAHKSGDDKKTSYYHSLLTTSVEDQMTYGAINFFRGHYGEPMVTYKSLITEHSTFLAVNVYLGICYFKMDYFDEALACARAYLDKYPDSPTAINLEASCLYRIVSPKSADQCLRKLKSFAESDLSFAKDLILHNTVVFRNGETALQVLPALVDVVPEARKNLIIYYLKKNDVDLAFSHAEGLTSKTPTEYLLKALVYVMLGYEKKQDPNIGRAAQYFKVVAESKDEESRSLFSTEKASSKSAILDTITGRLAMASYYFIIKDYHQAVIYYNSIIQFNKDDDRFNFNYGQANLFAENYEEAADALSKVRDPRYISYSTYQQSLVRACKLHLINISNV
uniref:Intraflagellar transport protein 56 n=1 Tax=Panagrolaimus superbus TaxID=310955 RepID=A0A914YU75_9BILA